jgi:hypothetical protein
VDARVYCSEETGHGREERRTYLQMPVPEDLQGANLWKGLKTIGMAMSECVRNGKETVEIRYFMSSLGVSVKRFADSVRSHWSIENPQPEDQRSDNLCAVGRADYHRRRRPLGVGRVERQELSGPRRHLMLNNDSICVPPRPRLLRRTH